MLWTTVLLSAGLTFSGCFLQPTTRVEKEYNIVDYDAPAVRLAKPVTAELLVKNDKGEWVNIGKGKLPAGAYIKGRSPVEPLPEVSKEK